MLLLTLTWGTTANTVLGRSIKGVSLRRVRLRLLFDDVEWIKPIVGNHVLASYRRLSLCGLGFSPDVLCIRETWQGSIWTFILFIVVTLRLLYWNLSHLRPVLWKRSLLFVGQGGRYQGWSIDTGGSVCLLVILVSVWFIEGVCLILLNLVVSRDSMLQHGLKLIFDYIDRRDLQCLSR